jgi:hypothetical protein
LKPKVEKRARRERGMGRGREREERKDCEIRLCPISQSISMAADREIERERYIEREIERERKEERAATRTSDRECVSEGERSFSLSLPLSHTLYKSLRISLSTYSYVTIGIIAVHVTLTGHERRTQTEGPRSKRKGK